MLSEEISLVFALSCLIGMLEGLCLRWYYKLRPRATFWIMIAANVVSGLIGWACLPWLVDLLRLIVPGRAPILQDGPIRVWLFLILFLETLVVEMPFCGWALWLSGRQPRKAAIASTAAQTISYAFLGALLLLINWIETPDEARLQKDLGFVREKRAWVMCLDDCGVLWRMHPDGFARQQVLATGCSKWDQRLYVAPNGIESSCSLVLAKDEATTTVLVSSFSGKPALMPAEIKEPVTSASLVRSASAAGRTLGVDLDPSNSWYHLRCSTDLRRTTTTSEWQLSRYRPGDGYPLRVRSASGQDVRVVYHDPALRNWSVACNPTVLPSGEIVFELNRQVCVLDPGTRRFGVIMAGRSPVVEVEESPE